MQFRGEYMDQELFCLVIRQDSCNNYRMESLFLHIHPENPQPRLIQQAIDVVRNGGIMVFPTDAAYVIGCHLEDKSAVDRIRALRQLDKKHHFTLICRDLSEIATYAHVNNPTYRLLKSHTPGPYTFILRATNEVPRRLQHPKRKTIGIRVPDCPIALSLLEELNEPLMCTTLIMPGQQDPLFDPENIDEKLSNQVDVIVDGGYGDVFPTSVIDLFHETPIIIRSGKGDTSEF